MRLPFLSLIHRWSGLSSRVTLAITGFADYQCDAPLANQGQAPALARAQQPDRMRRLSVLMGWDESDPEGKASLSGLMQGLAELGWTDGRNLRMDVRWAGDNVDQMRMFAKELVDLQPDVILAHTTPATAALQPETRTIPIVFVAVSDPVGAGFVTSLPRPGGNLTGVHLHRSGNGGQMAGIAHGDRARRQAASNHSIPTRQSVADYTSCGIRGSGPDRSRWRQSQRPLIAMLRSKRSYARAGASRREVGSSSPRMLSRASWPPVACSWGLCWTRPARCRLCSSPPTDPVGARYVASLARPGGNATGEDGCV